MPTRHTITLYQFAELPTEKAKDTARQWFRECPYNDDWYSAIYEDAANVHLKITGFDIGRGQKVYGEFTDSAENAATAILKDHGPDCDTFKTATAYLAELKALEDTLPVDAEYTVRDAEGFDAIEGEFLKSLLQDYWKQLRDESEYVDSDEYIEGGIIANEYTFLESGKRFAAGAK